MKKIKSFILAAVAFALVAPVFTACSSDDDKKNETVENIISEFSVNDKMVAEQKAKSGKNVAVLLVAFGSTWNNAFLAFDKTKDAYEAAFPNADVYVCFSSDICINRASVGENYDDNGTLVKRDYYEPRYLLHAIGAAKYSKIYVQSLQVIPGEEFAAVVASVKKFMNNGYIGEAHLDDAYLAKLAEDEAIFFGMPLLSDPDVDVPAVAAELNKLYASEASQGVVAFMGHPLICHITTSRMYWLVCRKRAKMKVRYSSMPLCLSQVTTLTTIWLVKVLSTGIQQMRRAKTTAGLSSSITRVTQHLYLFQATTHRVCWSFLVSCKFGSTTPKMLNSWRMLTTLCIQKNKLSY